MVLVVVKPAVVIQDGPFDLLDDKLEIVCANDAHCAEKIQMHSAKTPILLTLSPTVRLLNVEIEI